MQIGLVPPPQQVSEEVENLFLVGAGTHPGAGLPGVLSSARSPRQGRAGGRMLFPDSMIEARGGSRRLPRAAAHGIAHRSFHAASHLLPFEGARALPPRSTPSAASPTTPSIIEGGPTGNRPQARRPAPGSRTAARPRLPPARRCRCRPIAPSPRRWRRHAIPRETARSPARGPRLGRATAAATRRSPTSTPMPPASPVRSA